MTRGRDISQNRLCVHAVLSRKFAQGKHIRRHVAGRNYGHARSDTATQKEICDKQTEKHPWKKKNIILVLRAPAIKASLCLLMVTCSAGQTRTQASALATGPVMRPADLVQRADPLKPDRRAGENPARSERQTPCRRYCGRKAGNFRASSFHKRTCIAALCFSLKGPAVTSCKK
jgi:hypothetical protein